MIKRKRSTGWLAAISLTLLMLALAGCGGGSSDTAGTDTANSKSTATGSITATNGNSGASALSLSAPAGVTLSIPANTSFTDSSESPVTGSIATTVSYSNQVADLPVAARTVPAGSNLVAFADVSMASGAANVKSFSNPAALVFKVPVGVATTGDVLTVYSFDSSSANWNFPAAR